MMTGRKVLENKIFCKQKTVLYVSFSSSLSPKEPPRCLPWFDKIVHRELGPLRVVMFESHFVCSARGPGGGGESAAGGAGTSIAEVSPCLNRVSRF
jgi:hypothetical protein